MSHIVSIKTRLRAPAAIAAACQRLNLPQPVHGTATMYADQTAQGLLVQLPGWKFPIAIDTVSGEIKADNFSGYWGNQVEFDRFLQMYAVEMTKLQARQKGYAVSETQLQDGSIKLQIQENT